ncbi:hypothetical protein [Wolbachia endosymbiont of Armadillidium arcangelii]|uniref:Uncharacterized protein n=1 Tax=Wolbachia endosymbiont of Armadillidium arcangelii TaxID=3158571 RepID=A0AAU7Q1K7_9RICK
MADSGINITFNSEISECLAGLAKIRNKPVKKLVEELMQEAIENEEDKILIERAAELNVPGAETVDLKDVKWD